MRRSEVVTVRLDPKLRYLAELAARKQRRTVSSFIEWAVEAAFEHVILAEHANNDNHVTTTLAGAVGALWDVDEADRFVKLGMAYPDLLTHDEQIMWKVIWEKGYMRRDGSSGIKKWIVDADLLRDNFHILKAVGAGRQSASSLPESTKFQANGAKPK